MADLGAVIWHLESMAFSMNAIDGFRPPADLFQMRMHHSNYVINLKSAVELVAGVGNNGFYNSLDERMGAYDRPGRYIRDYVRELRNEIVHRGLDPVSGGVVVDGVTCAVAPVVWNQGREKRYSPPTQLLRDIFRLCEDRIKPVMEQHLEESIKAAEDGELDASTDEMASALRAAAHVPQWVVNIVPQVVTRKMIAGARRHQVQKLRALLKPYPSTVAR